MRSLIARLKTKPKLQSIVMVGLAAVASYHLGTAGYMWAKAELGQWLIADAWQQVLAVSAAKVKSSNSQYEHQQELAQEQQIEPWLGADTYPVAELHFPSQQKSQIVLAGTSDKNLAWAPTLLLAGSKPGQAGNMVISAHRDTHFAMLQNVQTGDVIEVTAANGDVHKYLVTDMQIVDSRTTGLDLQTQNQPGQPAQALLTLVTCYPFNALRPGGPMRYVVTAELG